MEKSTKNIVCITGKLNSFDTKAKAKEHLENLGYEVRSTVTKDVTILLNESGVESGKTKKARDNGVRIVTTIDELEETLNHNKSKDSLLKEVTRLSRSLSDKKDVISAVTLDGYSLRRASEELKADKEVVMAAVKENGNVLEYASEELKADKEVVMAAVKQQGSSLKSASEELRDNKEVVMAALKCEGWALEYASEELKADKEVVMVALRGAGWYIEYASKELKADKEVVMAAVKKHGMALEYASEELKADKEVVMAAVKQQGSSLKSASEELRDNKEVVMAALKCEGRALEYASSDLQEDKDIRRLVGLENITSDKSMTLSDKSMALKEHIQALLKDYQHYQEIDPNVINELIFTEDLISYLGKKNKNNKLLLIEILEEVDTNISLWDSGLSYPEWAYNDKDIALLLIGSAQVLLSDFSAKMRADKEVVMAALETDPEEIESVSKALQKDKDIIALMEEHE